VAEVVRGRLPDGTSAPEVGEEVVALVTDARVVIEHIASGRTPEPVAFDQAHDEWVVVLEAGPTWRSTVGCSHSWPGTGC
jgi:hypothetical protein